MLKKTFFICLIILSSLISISGFSVAKHCKEYVVKQVYDGDTIAVETPRRGVSKNAKQNHYLKIRLLGIDAFEYNQLPYGPKGKDFLAMLLLNKNVCVETDVDEKDVYGRTLGYVFVEPVSQRANEPVNKKKSLAHGLNGSSAQIFINEELLKNGLAILSNFPPNVKYINRLKKAQVYARKNMFGVWNEHSYITETPSEWRKRHPR